MNEADGITDLNGLIGYELVKPLLQMRTRCGGRCNPLIGGGDIRLLVMFKSWGWLIIRE